MKKINKFFASTKSLFRDFPLSTAGFNPRKKNRVNLSNLCHLCAIAALLCALSAQPLAAQPLDSTLNSARQLFDNAKYTELLQFLKNKEKEFEAANPQQYGAFLTLLGQTYTNLNNLPDAQTVLQKAQNILTDKTTDTYANLLNALGIFYIYKNDYPQAETNFLEAKSIRDKYLSTQTKEYATLLNNMGLFYIRKGEFDQAEIYLNQTISLWENILGTDNQFYAKPINNLGLLYFETGDYKKSEIYYLKASFVYKTFLGIEHPDYITSLKNLGRANYMIGDYVNAVQYYLEALSVQKIISDKEHPEYAQLLSSLGTLYLNMGDYQKSESCYLEARVIFENVYGKEHLDYGSALFTLGLLYNKIGEYKKAESLFLEAKEIRAKILGREHLRYARSLYTLATLYNTIGDYAKAEACCVEALTVIEKSVGKNHPDYAGTLYTLANIYYNKQEYQKTESYLLETKSIFEIVYGKKHQNYAIVLTDLGILYNKTGNYSKAEASLIDATTILQDVFGTEHPTYAVSLRNLALLYHYQGDYSKAETSFIEAKKIEEKVIGTQHPNFATTLNNLSNLHFTVKDYSQAHSGKIEADNITINQINKHFAFMSERQRELFWDINKNDFESCYSYVHSQPANEITAHAYDNTIFTKGLLLRTTNAIKETLLSSNNTHLIEMFELLRSNRIALNALLQSESPDLDLIKSLQNSTDSIDKVLTLASIEYKTFNEDNSIRWQHIRNVLQPDEVAIEFVHFRLFDGLNFSDTIQYCALIIKKDVQAPIWIPLFQEHSLLNLTTRSQSVSDIDFAKQLYSDNGDKLYNLIWQPIEKQLHNIKTVYYAPSGLLHQISFAAIPDAPNHKGTQSDFTKSHKDNSNSASQNNAETSHTLLLSDKYNLYLVSGTREILNLKNDIASNLPIGNAVLYGALFYEPQSSPSPIPHPPSPIPHSPASQPSAPQERGFGIKQRFLPGTEKETELIVKYLNEHQIPNKHYIFSKGSEDTFKQLSGSETGIIHISSHGFFFEDIEESTSGDLTHLISNEGRNSRAFGNRLSRSGLMFAGSNLAWTGNIVPPGTEDGILTAEEISQLNLINTQLVVLSACQTGLGEAKTAEGVFGLQRAFKLAGANTIIMSLWKVPDNATADLMTTFYQLWLSGKTIDGEQCLTTSGEQRRTKQQAFAEAQKQVREKYNDAYYWAGFVMLD